MARITKRSVDALVCPKGKDRVILWDDALSGFGCVAYPTGRKAFIVQYRQNGRSRRLNVGDFGRLTPDEARSEAKKNLGAIEAGADPIGDKRAARQARTFSAIANDFMRDHAAKVCKPRTQAEYDRWLQKRLLPAFGSRKMVSLTKSDLRRLHEAMADTPVEANHCLSLFRTIWNWAVKEDELASIDNPATKVTRYKENAKERFLTTAEIARLLAALDEGETIGLPYAIDETKPKARHAPKPENRRTIIDPFAVAAIRLLLLTGARRREILDAKWSGVDLERGILFLEDSKTGKKPIYLSAAAIAVFENIPKIKDNPYVIPGKIKGQPRADLNNPWAAVSKAADLKGLRLHDLRHSFASLGAGQSLGLPIIGKLLGHSQSATTQRYAHLDADPLRRAVNEIGQKITAAQMK